jgi:hypothetical protein
MPFAALALMGFVGGAKAQILLYAQRLPEGTVYVRLASALPAAASVQTDFAGKVDLGADGANRISPYFVAGSAGGKTVSMQVTEGGKTATATFAPKSGTFITVVLHQKGDAVTAAIVADKPEYNQLKARLTFYNATEDCTAGSLAEGSGRPVFANMPPDSVQARSINPVAATVTAACGGGRAAPLSLGQLDAGGLYSVWMMRMGTQITSFMARDTIAPPRS